MRLRVVDTTFYIASQHRSIDFTQLIASLHTLVYNLHNGDPFDQGTKRNQVQAIAEVGRLLAHRSLLSVSTIEERP
jgi:hypothetical protein